MELATQAHYMPPTVEQQQQCFQQQHFFDPNVEGLSPHAQIHQMQQMQQAALAQEASNEDEDCKHRKQRRSKYDVSHIVNSPVPNPVNHGGNAYALPDPTLDLKVSKSRTVFSEEQTVILEAAYRKDDHPDTEQRNMVAQMCGLSEECVRVWYQNRKARAKRQEEDRLAALITTQQQQQETLNLPGMSNKFNASLQTHPNSQPIVGRVVDKAIDQIFAKTNKTQQEQSASAPPPDEKKGKKKRSGTPNAKETTKRKRKTVSEEDLIRSIIRGKEQAQSKNPIPSQPLPRPLTMTPTVTQQNTNVYTTPSNSVQTSFYQNQQNPAFNPNQPQAWPTFPAHSLQGGPNDLMSPEQMKQMIAYQQSVIMSMQRMMMGGQILPWGQFPSFAPQQAKNQAPSPFQQQMLFNPVMPAMPMYQNPQMFEGGKLEPADFMHSPYAPLGTADSFTPSEASHSAYSPVSHCDDASRSSMNQEEANIQQAYAAASAASEPQTLASISSFADAITNAYGNHSVTGTLDQQQWGSYAVQTTTASPAAYEQIGGYSADSVSSMETASNPAQMDTTTDTTSQVDDNSAKECGFSASSGLPSTILTEDQVGMLEAEYQKNNHPDDEQRSVISQTCGMSEECVRLWYENRNEANDAIPEGDAKSEEEMKSKSEEAVESKSEEAVESKSEEAVESKSEEAVVESAAEENVEPVVQGEDGCGDVKAEEDATETAETTEATSEDS